MAEKKLGSTVEQRRRLIEPGNEEISISRQCELLGLCRSGFYYKAIGESGYSLELMRLIDEYLYQASILWGKAVDSMIKRERT